MNVPRDESPVSHREWRVSDFDYDLPDDLIAQTPLPDRDASRMLVIQRTDAAFVDAAIRDLGAWLEPGDLLVANNSRVLPARFQGHRRDSGGRVEFLLLREESAGIWITLAKPARRLRPGVEVELIAEDQHAAAVVIVRERRAAGEIVIEVPDVVSANLEAFGMVPLPPYITKRLEDAERYQTVYANTLGSAAAPTAGLHFTPNLLRNLAAAGIGWGEVTLHVGVDTFRPMSVDRVADHVMHSEQFVVSADILAKIRTVKRAGRRVIAVGTTSARTLESVAEQWNWRTDEPRDVGGFTDIFIVPGHDWRMVDGLITNFHLPRSTLLMMVSSLAGTDAIERAYAHAVRERYRFFSFGDAMLIL